MYERYKPNLKMKQPQKAKRRPEVLAEQDLQLPETLLCNRCGSDEHQDAGCPHFPPRAPVDILRLRLGLNGRGEDLVREAVLGTEALPSRFFPRRATGDLLRSQLENQLGWNGRGEDLVREAVLGMEGLPSRFFPRRATTNILRSQLENQLQGVVEFTPIDVIHDATDDHDTRYIAVRNLSRTANDAMLWHAFEEFGEVMSAGIIIDPQTGRPRGRGHVAFVDPADAAKALAAPTIMIGGRRVRIRPFSPNSSYALDARRKDIQLLKNTKIFSRRVHVLGLHELGKLAAHSLASTKGRPPITLLIHTDELERQWRLEGERILVVRNQRADARIGFDIDRTWTTQAQHARRTSMGTGRSPLDDPWIISNLIVAEHGWATVKGLSLIRDRLNADSTILFLQDIEGVIDRVNEEVFQNPATRPQYLRAYSSHGVANHPSVTFALKHYSQGVIQVAHCGDLPIGQLKEKHPSAADFFRTLEYSDPLNVVPKPTRVMLAAKLRRLAVDAVMGPLSVAFDCKIGDLCNNYMVTQNVHAMLTEIVAVMKAMPELEEFRDKEACTVHSLRELVTRVCEQMQANTEHKMAKDLKEGRRTDEQFRTGYFVAQGVKYGVPTPVLTAMLRLVKAKQGMVQKHITNYIPFEKARRYKIKG